MLDNFSKSLISALQALEASQPLSSSNINNIRNSTDKISEYVRSEHSSNRKNPHKTRLEQLYGFGIGSSFPASPKDNDLFFRSDIGMLAYYNGTYWLSFHEFMITVPTIVTTINGGVYWRVRSDYQPYYTRYESTSAVTGNTTTDYWIMTLYSQTITIGAATQIAAYNTQPDTAATFTDHSANINVAPANYGILQVNHNKVGSPSTFQLFISVYYKLILG